MRIIKKLKFWGRRSEAFASDTSVTLEDRLGALEYEYSRLEHDISMVLLPETRQTDRRYPH